MYAIYNCSLLFRVFTFTQSTTFDLIKLLLTSATSGTRTGAPRWSVPPPTSTTSRTWARATASRYRGSWTCPPPSRRRTRWQPSYFRLTTGDNVRGRLVTAAAARARWRGLSPCRESSRCSGRARGSCRRRACPPTRPRPSAPSATQRWATYWIREFIFLILDASSEISISYA